MSAPTQPAPLSGQVAEDRRTLELTIDAACEDAVYEAKFSATDRAALSRLAAKAQQEEALLADNAALVSTIRKLVKGDMGQGIVEAHAALHGKAPHPGAALLEDLKKKDEAIRALANQVRADLAVSHARHPSLGEIEACKDGRCRRLLDLLDAAGVAP